MGKITDLVEQMFADNMPPAAIIAAVREAESGARRNVGVEFDRWWAAYPAKIGKGAAEKAFEKARRLATFEVLLDGVMRYAAKRDDRPWCHASTWLSQRRWEDEEAQPILPQKGLAGVRARLELEIANEHRHDQIASSHAAGGLSLFGQYDYGRGR